MGKEQNNKKHFVEDRYEELYNEIFEGDCIFLSDDLNSKDDEVSKDGKILEKYEKYKKEKKIFEIYSVRADTAGNVYCSLEGNITGIIPNPEIEGKKYNPYYRHKKIDRHYSVIVTDVDFEKKIVTLSHHKAKNIGKEILKQRLLKALENKENIKVKARVMFVAYNNRVYLDIGGVGLLGYVPIDEWSHVYVENLEDEVKNGDIIEVVPMKYKPKQKVNGKKKNEAFICSRKETLPDPWIGIEEKVPRYSTLVVECTDKKPHMFFGRTEGLELNIYCEYPEPERNIVVLEGMKYKGFVYNVSEEKKLLKVRIFDTAD